MSTEVAQHPRTRTYSWVNNLPPHAGWDLLEQTFVSGMLVGVRALGVRVYASGRLNMTGHPAMDFGSPDEAKAYALATFTLKGDEP